MVSNFWMMGLIIVTIVACGKDSSNSEGEKSGAGKGDHALTVASMGDLPTCDAEQEGQLIYVRDDKEFKTCSDGDWADIDVRGKDGKGTDGKNGVDGLQVASNKLIDAYGTDMCTGIADEYCYLDGGQLIKYTDGSVFVMGLFRYAYDAGGDTDIDNVATSLFFPADATVSYVRMSAFVHRGVGYRSLYLTYSKAGDVLKLLYDADNDGYEDTDTVITTLTVSEWGS